MNNDRISCIIHTFNSEFFIDECLKSVSWCDEIIVIDMYSTDKTVEISKKHNAKIYFHENVGYADPARAFGLEKAEGKWVLSIDSDEIVPKMLAEELIKIKTNDLADVVKISFRNFFFGKEILGSGWGYKNQVIPRFFKKSAIRYTAEVHNFLHINSDSKIVVLVDKNKSIIHFNYVDVSHFIRKLNTYTDAEVNSTKYAYAKFPGFKIIYHALREFIGRFFYLKGYKDGWIGIYLALSMSFYRASAVAKANTKNHLSIVKEYKKIAEEVNLDKFR